MSTYYLKQNRSLAATPVAVFPLAVSSNGHYYVTASGVPRPVLGLNAWSLIELSESSQIAFLNAIVAMGFNHTEVWIPNGFSGTRNPWHDGANNLPFSLRLDGAAWAGSRTYVDINAEAPDFTTLNEPYWQSADRLLTACEVRGIDVDLFPCYAGFDTTPVQGWNNEMVANGATKMQAYGVALATRWRTRPNIRLMWGGDRQVFDASQIAVWSALITGLKSVSTVSTQYAAEWLRDSISSDQTNFGSQTTEQSAYARSTQVVNQCTRGYATSKVTYLMEAPFDETETSPPVGDPNPDATPPIRRHGWRGWLSARGGYMVGNGWIFGFVTGWESHLTTQCLLDCMRLNNYILSLAWWTLAPTTTLVTAGNSAITSDAYIAQAIDASSNARLAVIYVPPADSGAFTVDMSLFAGTVTARWFDPTAATYTAIGTFPASGTQDFTVPGNNAQGTYDDWTLELRA